MPKTLIYKIIFLGIICALTHVNGQERIQWSEWGQLPENPALKDMKNVQPGLAGAYSGISNGVLIVAGGANFPYDTPWEGGEKVWWSDIYIGRMHEEGLRWQSEVYTLPVPMAYGVSIPWEEGLLILGGNNREGAVSKVYLLTWDSVKEELNIEEQPSLPSTFEVVNGAECNGILYLHGISNNENTLLQRQSNGEWLRLPGCPGLPRSYSVGAGQNNGVDQDFYLFGGRSVDENGEITILHDAYQYDTSADQWLSLGEMRIEGQALNVMAGSGIATGSSHITILGGDDGIELLERAELEKKIKETKDPIERAEWSQALTAKFINHRGFSNQIWSFHTITQTWTLVERLPTPIPVTTNIFKNGDKIIMTSGEVKPGIRDPKIWRIVLPTQLRSFGWLNYIVIFCYLLGMVVIGLIFSRRQNSTEDYFKGGGRIPWWAAGLSLFGTSLSAITFMAIPAKTYMTDWSYFFFQMTPLLAAPILIAWYIPYYRQLNITTAYEFLERRFNLLTRILGSISFMILQLGRVGIVLYLPSIAIQLVTGIQIEICILVMGIVSIVYTMMGGIEAVIWTDVLQVIVLMGGALVCLFVLFSQIDGSAIEIYQNAANHQKFNIIDASLDMSKPTIWVVLLGGFFANLITSGSDQTMVQRYITTASVSEAKQSVWTFALLAIPATLLFFTMGTLLFLFYSQNPAQLDATLMNDDAIFPWYIVSQLPAGVSGLLIAGIFSAAMSSLSSSMNSVATAFMTDFYQRFSWGNLTSELTMARIATLVFGIIGTVFALMMATWEIQSLWDQLQLYIGLFAGGLGGIFLLGVTSKKANSFGAIMGLFSSTIIQIILNKVADIHVLLFAMTGFVAAYGIGYVVSLLRIEGQNETKN